MNKESTENESASHKLLAFVLKMTKSVMGFVGYKVEKYFPRTEFKLAYIKK